MGKSLVEPAARGAHEPRGVRALVCSLTLAGFAACAGAPPPEREFADRATAVQAGAIDDGSLPAWLPPSTRAIRERTSRTSNERWLRFEFDAADLDTFAAACEEVPPLQAIHPRLSRTDRIAWWNRELRIASSQGLDRYRMYRCHRDDPAVPRAWRYLAVDPARGFAWYWELRH